MKRKLNSNRGFQTAGHLILGIYSILCLIPFILLFMSSISDEEAIIREGYSLWPRSFSLSAYGYLMEEGSQIFRAYGMTVLSTLVGTSLGVMVTMMLGYTLSRKDLPKRKVLNFYVFFTMLFNGGLVPTYLMYTEYLHIKNTFWALVIPALLVNGFNLMITRSFLQSNIPVPLIEAAEIDGAGEYYIFGKVVFPLAKPIVATIGLFIGIAYWNDWMNGLYYLTDTKLFTIQNVLNRILSDAQFLSNNSSVAGNMSEAMANLPTTTVRMAIAFVGMLPILVIYPFVQKYFVKGIALGAVKG